MRNLFLMASTAGAAWLLQRLFDFEEKSASSLKSKGYKEEFPEERLSSLVPGTRFFSSSEQGRFRAFCRRTGSNSLIVYGNRLKEDDSAAWRFVMLHELGHANDKLSVPATLGAGVGLIRICIQRRSLAGALFSSLALRVLGGNLQERYADHFAVTHATQEELEGALRFFSSVPAKKSLYSLFDPHPSLISRINKVKSYII